MLEAIQLIASAEKVGPDSEAFITDLCTPPSVERKFLRCITKEFGYDRSGDALFHKGLYGTDIATCAGITDELDLKGVRVARSRDA